MSPYQPTTDRLQEFLRLSPEAASDLARAVLSQKPANEVLALARELLDGQVRKLWSPEGQLLAYYVVRSNVRRPLRAYTIIYDVTAQSVILQTPRYFMRDVACRAEGRAQTGGRPWAGS